MSGEPSSAERPPAAGSTGRRRLWGTDTYARLGRWLAETRIGPLPAAIVAVALYCTIQTVAVGGLSAWAGIGVGLDDAEQLTYLPFPSLGYGGSQPPLMPWLDWLGVSVFGTNVFALKLVKEALMFGACLAVYRTMRGLGYERTTAAAAMFGLIVMPQFIWRSQHTWTHTVAAVTFNAVALLAFVGVFRRRSVLSYALFGAAAGVAMLAKYNDVIFLGAIVIAAASVRDLRPAVLDRRMLLSLLLACAIVTPTALWSINHPEMLLAHSGKFGIGASSGVWTALGLGLGKLSVDAIKVAAMPVAVFAFAVYCAGPMPSSATPALPMPALAATDRFLWRGPFVALAGLFVLVAASGTTDTSNRWLYPVLLMMPLAFAAALRRYGDRGNLAQRITIGITAAIAIIAAPASLYENLSGSSSKQIGRLDYRALYRDLTRDGPVRTVVADTVWIGNLRLVDSGLRAIHDEMPAFVSLIEEPAILVWRGADLPPGRRFLADLRRGGYVPAGQPRPIEVPPTMFSPTRSTATIMAVRLVRQGAGAGRDPPAGP